MPNFAGSEINNEYKLPLSLYWFGLFAIKMVKFMRLSDFERTTLKQTAQACFGADAAVRLFGSRVDDSKRGGDIDLLIQTQLADPERVVKARTQFLVTVQSLLGEQKIDVLIDFPTRQSRAPIYAVAQAHGVLL